MTDDADSNLDTLQRPASAALPEDSAGATAMRPASASGATASLASSVRDVLKGAPGDSGPHREDRYVEVREIGH